LHLDPRRDHGAILPEQFALLRCEAPRLGHLAAFLCSPVELAINAIANGVELARGELAEVHSRTLKAAIAMS
jgi:hypothetical protein